ncbi:hypothetical protein C5F59_033185 [Streptomyces sp. QL37]|uniref:hypothetical protein n=1 Tax=Streptomyces sp. QL37 TaxID=2093747 RepID=UPI00137531A7|nr:hypothetical protein [Streptomyces sp. QL37]
MRSYITVVWGQPDGGHLTAVHRARRQLGVPGAAPRTVTGLTGDITLHPGRA